MRGEALVAIGGLSTERMLEERHHIGRANRRQIGLAVTKPMIEEPVGEAPAMVDRARA